ncbi:unnamed protein product [Urochloa decumbens]|uniref:Serpin domain-containing protein n=1 Tax=Urochloa decumbens TaxID=240449 RepID=A0ABC8VZY7_9POAL
MHGAMEEEASPRLSKKARGVAGSGLTDIALRLAKRLTDGAAGDGGLNHNLVFSPVSIYAALSLVAAGARGTTLDELLALLGAASRDELAESARGVSERALTDRSGSASGAPLVAFACGVWHEQTVALKPAYQAVAAESYKAKTHAADFKYKPEKERERINHWVSEATDDLITSILPPGSVHSLTGLVIANAIYFKGRWSMPFNERDTETRQFHLLNRSTVDTRFMCSRRDHAIAVHKGFKVLKLAYHPYWIPHWEDKYRRRNKQQDSDDDSEQPRFSMCVFLPDAWDGLSELVEKMASCPTILWDHLPKNRRKTSEVRLPKFKLSFSSQINDVLRSMGMEAAFDIGKADLTDMLEGDQPLVVEHVFHKAVIEVDEEGTKAAASTGCSIKLKCCTFPVDFVADHPFAFFVVEEVSGTVVFMGHVIDPTRSE